MSHQKPASSPKARALAYLATVLDNPTAKPVDRQRAAEAILRADAPALKGLHGAAAALTDAELEATARGEGGRPPQRGPVSGVTGTGPIRESAFAPGGRNPILSGQKAGGVPQLEGPQPHFSVPQAGGPTPGDIARAARKQNEKLKKGPKASLPGKREVRPNPISRPLAPPTEIEPIRLNPISPNLTSATISDEDTDPCT